MSTGGQTKLMLRDAAHLLSGVWLATKATPWNVFPPLHVTNYKPIMFTPILIEGDYQPTLAYGANEWPLKRTWNGLIRVAL